MALFNWKKNIYGGGGEEAGPFNPFEKYHKPLMISLMSLMIPDEETVQRSHPSNLDTSRNMRPCVTT